MKDDQNAMGAPAHGDGPESATAWVDASGMRCEACGHGELRPGRISTVFRTDERLAVIRDVPAMICPACREEYLDDITATRLDLMRGQGFSTETVVAEITVPVYTYRPGGESGRS